jgi:D-3-phosphoglycerate dehydrogenase / 2-oxoglutarate reductase
MPSPASMPTAAVVAVLGTRYPDFSIEESVLAPDGIEIVSGPGGSPDEIVDVAGAAQVIVAGSRPRFTEEVLERLAGRAIVRAGIGLDSIDLDAARRLGYVVAYVPDASSEAVAQHTLALSLAAGRRLIASDRIIRDGEWGFDVLRPLHLPSSLTAGVVGFGRIGRRIAELYAAVGFRRVLVHDAYVEATGPGIAPRDLDSLLAEADIVTLHAPAPSGGPLIGARELGLMKTGSVLVNTARGSLVDPAALARALAEGRPGMAALDVFDPEPPDLAAFEGVADRMIFSPHTAWYSEESQTELRRKSAEEARRIISGAAPLNPVVQPEDRP